MISQIHGRIEEKNENSVLVNVGGVSYEVLIPSSVMQHLDSITRPDGSVSLVTYHYFQSDPSRSVPVLIGFSNRIEREFFIRFISVSGVGPKAAVRALSAPFSHIAQAIDEGDMNFLKSLPGVGEQRAREIVAKLQGKVGQFVLIRDGDSSKGAPKVSSDIEEEAMMVLLQLQYKRDEAKQMIQKARTSNPKVKTVEELLNEVYKQKKTE